MMKITKESETMAFTSLYTVKTVLLREAPKLLRIKIERDNIFYEMRS